MRKQTTIRIPTPLRTYTDGLSSVGVEGATVGELLQNLTGRFPVLRKHLYDDSGSLRSFVNIYLNDDDVRYRDGLATAVTSEDSLSIVPSIAGGSRGRETLCFISRP